MNPITIVTSLIDRALWRWPNLDHAARIPEHTWLNHALLTFIVGGGLGALLGGAVQLLGLVLNAIPFVDWRVGLEIGVVAFAVSYQWREMRQWSGRRHRPPQWWWDATLDILSPWLVVAIVRDNRIAAAILFVAIGVFHWLLRRESETSRDLLEMADGIERGTISDPASMLREFANEV